MSIRRFFSLPLIQFLLLGTGLFGAYSLVREEPSQTDRQIIVSTQQIEQLSMLWPQQWRRPPTEQELTGLIESRIREEILYREAQALGLDRDDTVIRRRLAQKIEMLAQDLATQGDPSDAELETFFREHPDTFEVPSRVTFEHVYVSRDTRGSAADDAAMGILEALRKGADPTEQGDRFMLQRQYLRKQPDEVARHFGNRFAAEVIELPTGQWVGPVESGYGIHLVYVEALEEPYLPSFEDSKDDIRNEYLSFKRREMDELFYSKLREGYEVVVEDLSEEAS